MENKAGCAEAGKRQEVAEASQELERFGVQIVLAHRCHSCDFAHSYDNLIMKVIMILVTQLHQKPFELV